MDTDDVDESETESRFTDVWARVLVSSFETRVEKLYQFLRNEIFDGFTFSDQSDFVEIDHDFRCARP